MKAHLSILSFPGKSIIPIELSIVFWFSSNKKAEPSTNKGTLEKNNKKTSYGHQIDMLIKNDKMSL